MPPNTAIKLVFTLFGSLVLSACSSSRQIAVDYPKAEATALRPLNGQNLVSADDYYVQLLSEFDFKTDNALKAGCSDFGSHYENIDLSAALIFSLRNEALKFKRESNGFLYQAGNGKCNFKLETRKQILTPWLRLDTAKDTVIDYNFLTSHSSESNLNQVFNDVNAASNLLALTGVGTGVAVLGKTASTWAQQNTQLNSKPAASAQHSSETHTLPAVVNLDVAHPQLLENHLGVYEVINGGLQFWSSQTRLLGEMRIYPQLSSSLLLKPDHDGVPDAHDLSLDELWHIPMQGGEIDNRLKQVIEKAGQSNTLNLNPDWQNYSEVENQCRKLKLSLKDLGFNKFDRNAVLYYFLLQAPDWKNFNITSQRAMADSIRPKQLDDFRSKDFSGCLAEEDYRAMQAMHLPVNSHQDWDNLTRSRQKKEDSFAAVQSIGRQLLAALKNSDQEEMSRQLYPLLHHDQQGLGFSLLQNNLGNFALESLLGIPAMSPEGVVVSANQIANLFSHLGVENYSCVRPALEQGKPLSHLGIILFVTQPGSPREKGGALEFELGQGKITRLSFQHPSFRDFEQNLSDYPDLGGCHVDNDMLMRLH